jgi:hypothetical protein
VSSDGGYPDVMEEKRRVLNSRGIEHATEHMLPAEERGDYLDAIWWAEALERVLAGVEKKRRR